MPDIHLARIRLGAFEFNPRAGELIQAGQVHRLQEKSLRVLKILIENGTDVVTRDELQKKLWPNDTIVDFDHGINTAIRNLRRALGDSAESPSYIETVARRGYRLMVPVEWVSPAEDSSDDVSSRADPERSRGGVEGPAVGASDGPAKAKLKVGRLTGKVVSHYRVLEVIGGGGMGLVYRAEDLKLSRAVALKFLPEEVGDDPEARERFEREAQAVSTLDHSNICSIYEFDEYEGHPFIVMQLLQGRTLRDHLADGRLRLTQPEGLEIAIQIASGLEAAHEKGIIHRDIKPANIFITEKNVAKILDFGVAKMVSLSAPSPAVILSDERSEESKDPYRGEGAGIGVPRLRSSADGGLNSLGMTQEINATGSAPQGVPFQAAAAAPAKETTLTRTGMKLGTAGYMSPEQVRGEPLDARTDIFSFGLVLYEMATGERAFTGETEAILHDAIQHREPRPIPELAPGIPPKLESIVARCLQKDRAFRYQHAGEVRHDLQQVLAALAEVAKSSHWRKRWLAIAAILMICAGSIWLYRRIVLKPKLRAGATLVLADTVNATNDALLNQTLELPLRTEFHQTPFFNILNNGKVQESLRMLKQENSQLTSDLARKVCLQTNSDALLRSAIKDAGDQYVIELTAVRCDNGAEIARARVEADQRDQIVKMLGVAGAQLRERLGEPASSVAAFNKPLDKATSGSLEALNAFAQGTTARSREGDAVGRRYVEQAVELDPRFATAQLVLGMIYSNIGENVRAAESLRAAFALREQVPENDRSPLEAEYYSVVTGEIDKAIAAYERYAERFRRDVMSDHGELAYHLRVIGQPEQAADEARKGNQLQPSWAGTYNLALSEMAMGQTENAKQALDEAQTLGFEAPLLSSAWYMLAFCNGDSGAMRRQVVLAIGKPGFEPVSLSKDSETAAFAGQFEKARLLAERAAILAQKEGTSETSKRLLLEQAFREAAVGNAAFAQNILKKLRPLSDDMYANSVAAITMANSGDIAGASDLARRTSDKHPLDTLAQKFWLPAAWGLIDLRNNQPTEAIKRLEVSSAYELAQPGVWEPFGNMYPTYVRGLAYLKANQGQDAAKEFQKIIDRRGLILNFIIGSLAHLQLARAYAMSGDNDAARKSYQDFLTLWKDADPDIPIYKQAKAEYAKLQ
jgi:eukaryotic-like serine/threonine-protein kinase